MENRFSYNKNFKYIGTLEQKYKIEWFRPRNGPERLDWARSAPRPTGPQGLKFVINSCSKNKRPRA